MTKITPNIHIYVSGNFSKKISTGHPVPIFRYAVACSAFSTSAIACFLIGIRQFLLFPNSTITFHTVQHSLKSFLLFFLRADHQEIHNSKDDYHPNDHHAHTCSSACFHFVSSCFLTVLPASLSGSIITHHTQK